MAILDSDGFRVQLGIEVARTSRLGGFLTVGVLGLAGPPAPEGPAIIDDVAAALAPRMRAYDVAGRLDPSTLGIAVPGADSVTAARASRRLLDVGTAAARGFPLALGIATAYGEIEGGLEAALEAAKLALASAGPGEVGVSHALRPRPRVLVVDDDEAFSLAFAESLSERGWDAHPCTNSAEALARVSEPTYNALFVDLVMPGHSGVDVLREALRYAPKRPAILMSGHDSQHGAILDALTLGPVMFIRKPVEPNDLDLALRMFGLLLPGLSPEGVPE